MTRVNFALQSLFVAALSAIIAYLWWAWLTPAGGVLAFAAWFGLVLVVLSVVWARVVR